MQRHARKEPKYLIYIAYHKQAPLLDSPSITPIHVGRARANAPLAKMIGDDTGDNISTDNASYCELTALYWAWKNGPKGGFVGLMHYRRVLDVQNIHQGAAQAEIFVNRFHIPDWLDGTEAWLAEAAQPDITLPRMHRMGMSVEENFNRGHRAEDFQMARQVIARDHPTYLNSFENVAAGHAFRLGNIFVMRRSIFERYCAWLFDILAKVAAADIDRSAYSQQQMRYLGFLAERLFTVFVDHEKAQNPALRLHEVAILNSSKALVTPYDTGLDLNGPAHINVAFSADRTYLPQVAAMVRSLLDHVDPGRQLNLFFLHDGICDTELALLNKLLNGHPNAAFHPIHSGTVFENSYRSPSRAASNATYNRFLLFSLLPHLERVLYLDCDLIIQRDIAALFDTNMQGAQVAAVTDWIMTRTLTGPVTTADPKVPDLHAYQRSTLGLNDAQIGRYFNAGVVLFDLTAIPDLAATSRALNEMAHAGQYLFRDQDILNNYFKNHVLLLDARWNVFNSPDESYAKVAPASREQAMRARQDPWILHFADGANKPWLGKEVSGSSAYWQALIRTPFYHEALSASRKPQGRVPLKFHLAPRLVEAGKSLSQHMPFLRVPLLRLYALVNRRRF